MSYQLLNRQPYTNHDASAIEQQQQYQEQEKQLLPNGDLLSAEEEARIPHRNHIQKHSFKGHMEEHFSRPELVRDCILGLSDGLTVPFALAAGLSSLGDSRIVIFGGIAGKLIIFIIIYQKMLVSYIYIYI